MKLNMARLRIAGLVLLSVVSSGCTTTRAVTNIGKRNEMLNEIRGADSVVMAEDGAIAVKVWSVVSTAVPIKELAIVPNT